MNQTRILLGVILLMGAAFGFLWWSQQNQMADTRQAQAELMKLLAQQQGTKPETQAAPVAPVANQAATSPTDTAESANQERIQAMNAEMLAMREEMERIKAKNDADLEEKERLAGELERAKFEIDQRLQLIRSAPMLTKVSKVLPEHGFVVIAAGRVAGVQPGDQFSIRRGDKIISKIQIGQSVDDSESVADPVAGSMVHGEQIQEGDEVVKMD